VALRGPANPEIGARLRVIALLPVRNEAWVLRHTLDCLSGFCDVVLVHDQSSEDGSREICREFPRVVLLAADGVGICEQARFALLDAARDYDGKNLLWFNDADELVSPARVTEFLARLGGTPRPGTALECQFYNLWKTTDRYRDDLSAYRPHLKAMAFVDDRKADYDRRDEFPLHTPRVPLVSPAETLRAPQIPVLHLQWLLWNRNQVKQAWYRCREWLQGGKTAAAINAFYSITFDAHGIRTTPVPEDWVRDVSFPHPFADGGASWHEREILAWFDRDGIERFEPLEIWHIESLRDEFRRRTGRRPRPDRSYRPSWTYRARGLAGRAIRAARRRAGL
jgi:hypothetical protein